jgi:hypothetical protein
LVTNSTEKKYTGSAGRLQAAQTFLLRTVLRDKTHKLEAKSESRNPAREASQIKATAACT